MCFGFSFLPLCIVLVCLLFKRVSVMVTPIKFVSWIQSKSISYKWYIALVTTGLVNTQLHCVHDNKFVNNMALRIRVSISNAAFIGLAVSGFVLMYCENSNEYGSVSIGLDPFVFNDKRAIDRFYQMWLYWSCPLKQIHGTNMENLQKLPSNVFYLAHALLTNLVSGEKRVWATCRQWKISAHTVRGH